MGRRAGQLVFRVLPPPMQSRLSPPRMTHEAVLQLVRDRFGIDGQSRELPSERDQNFLISSEDGDFVLKVTRREEEEWIRAQNGLLDFLADKQLDFETPQVRRSLDGETLLDVEGDEGWQVRLLEFVPGRVMAHARPFSPVILGSLGCAVAQLDHALAEFESPAFKRDFFWDLARSGSVVEEHISAISDPERRGIVEYFLQLFREQTEPALQNFSTSIIYNDANDYNVLVDGCGPDADRIAGLVDFGDAVETCTVFDLAVAIAYAVLEDPDPLGVACHVVAGYHKERELGALEIQHLFVLVAMRLCTSVSISAARTASAEGNSYHVVSEGPVWNTLRELRTIGLEYAVCRIRQACGHPAHTKAAALNQWLAERKGKFGFVLEALSKDAESVVLDLRAGGSHLSGLRNTTDVSEVTPRLFGVMADAGAKLGIGRYGESRSIYGTQEYRPRGRTVDNWRTVHLGIDLFVVAKTPVCAPFDAKIESVQWNEGDQDYGPTVILRHSLGEGGAEFFTLYGHLDPDTLTLVSAGQAVKQGQRIGWVGNAPDNGGWPPHLHFQILVDLFHWEGTYPGVASSADSSFWLEVCPDPNLILDLPVDCGPLEEASTDDLVAERHKRLSPSLTTSYFKPLKIVQGIGTYLYDHLGRPYLDCINNVCHVGHCNPTVVDAIHRQALSLNTNTRYLHEKIIEYSKRLCATLPDPLEVCFFVNSGSEANELALRLARAFTGNSETIVVDGAYHGNTGGLIEISPYKFDGPGGEGALSHVHKLAMPDLYRGEYRDPKTAAGAHMDAVDRLIEHLAPVAPTFICESILSCGGQIPLPPEYLQRVYSAVRDVGGVCIADEVQVGFGRVGDTFWAFELQRVVPDIVTMGKPMGNGHPVAAVVTTREVADALDTGMEYFNTFGGNPVSCAAALAVLDVIESEGLQQRAADVGAHLKKELEGLRERFEIVGDVRGHGLFLGLELVTDRASQEPAAHGAKWIVEFAKDRGVLLSTDGPLQNVIKIKPSMTFSKSDADFVVLVLDLALAANPLSAPESVV